MLVRYVTPFGSPAYMEREQAEVLLNQEEALWQRLDAAGGLSEEQRCIGAPRIELGGVVT